MFKIQAKMNPEFGGEILHCALCCNDEFDCQMHIDHMDGRDWEVREVASHTRTTRYMREFESGIRMRLLCKPCNTKNKPTSYRPVLIPVTEEAF